MPMSSSTGSGTDGRASRATFGRRTEVVRDAIVFCAQPSNLSRTIRIALVVGVLLTLINQGSVIASGHAKRPPGSAAY